MINGVRTIGILAVLAALGAAGPPSERSVACTMVEPIARGPEPAKISPTSTPAQLSPATSSPLSPPPATASAAPVDTASPALRASEVPVNSMHFKPPAQHLYGIIQKAMGALYKAATPEAFHEQEQALRKTLAADSALPDESLAAEKQRFLDQLADMHSREPRVYPGEQTMQVYDALMRALDGALADRHAQGKPSPSP